MRELNRYSSLCQAAVFLSFLVFYTALSIHFSNVMKCVFCVSLFHCLCVKCVEGYVLKMLRGVFDVLIFHCLCFLPEGAGHQQAVHWVNRVDRILEWP